MLVAALPEGSDVAFWTILLVGFIYPTMFHLLASRSRHTRALGLASYVIDGILSSLELRLGEAGRQAPELSDHPPGSAAGGHQ
jgi:hypothetical protein